jgi:hypothetical protein
MSSDKIPFTKPSLVSTKILDALYLRASNFPEITANRASGILS